MDGSSRLEKHWKLIGAIGHISGPVCAQRALRQFFFRVQLGSAFSIGRGVLALAQLRSTRTTVGHVVRIARRPRAWDRVSAELAQSSHHCSGERTVTLLGTLAVGMCSHSVILGGRYIYGRVTIGGRVM